MGARHDGDFSGSYIPMDPGSVGVCAWPEGLEWTAVVLYHLRRFSPSDRGLLDFDCQMRQVVTMTQPGAIGGWFFRIGRVKGDDGPMMPWSRLPDVQVGDPITVNLQRLANFLGQIFVLVHLVQQDLSGIADETPGPSGDDTSSDYPDHWVHPVPAVQAAGEE